MSNFVQFRLRRVRQFSLLVRRATLGECRGRFDALVEDSTG